jgi:hypothetical protein
MSDIQDLSTIVVAYKAQSGLGVPASGASGKGLEVVASTGMAVSIAAIESAMLSRTRMKRRPRHGMRTVTAAYETELSAGPCDPIFEAVLGGTQLAAQNFSNADWGDCTITGTGTTCTFASGTLLTDGIVAGQMIKFTNLSVSENNAKWVPILAVTAEGVCTFPSGYLADNTTDAAWTAVIAKSLKTTNPYVNRYFSFEENMPDTAVDMSKYATDARFNSLNVAVSPTEYVKVGFGIGARDMEIKTVGDAPVFTSPTYITAESLILLDGGIYVNGVKRLDMTSFKFGLAAPVSTIPVIGTNVSPDVFLGQFAFSGDFTGVVADSTDFAAFDAETPISVLLHCKEESTENFVSFYLGNLSFAGYSTPAGGEGALIQSVPLFGGSDLRGAGYAETTVLISTSAA